MVVLGQFWLHPKLRLQEIFCSPGHTIHAIVLNVYSLQVSDQTGLLRHSKERLESHSFQNEQNQVCIENFSLLQSLAPFDIQQNHYLWPWLWTYVANASQHGVSCPFVPVCWTLFKRARNFIRSSSRLILFFLKISCTRLVFRPITHFLFSLLPVPFLVSYYWSLCHTCLSISQSSNRRYCSCCLCKWL